MGKWLDNFKEKVSDWYNDSDQFYLRTITDPIIKLGKTIYNSGSTLSEIFTPVYSDVKAADDIFNAGLNNLKQGNYLQGFVQTAGAPILGAAFMTIPNVADASLKGQIKMAKAADAARTVDNAVDLSKLSTAEAKKIYDDLMQQQTTLLQQLKEAEYIPGVQANQTLQKKLYMNENGSWVGNTWVTPPVDYSAREAAMQAIKDQINAVNQQIRNLSAAGHNFTGYIDESIQTGLKPNQYYVQAADGTVGYATKSKPRTRTSSKSTTSASGKNGNATASSPASTQANQPMSEIERQAKRQAVDKEAGYHAAIQAQDKRLARQKDPSEMTKMNVTDKRQGVSSDKSIYPKVTTYLQETLASGFTPSKKARIKGDVNLAYQEWIDYLQKLKYDTKSKDSVKAINQIAEETWMKLFQPKKKQGGILNYLTLFS